MKTRVKVGLPWYDPDTYSVFRVGAATDPRFLATSFGEWLEEAESYERQLIELDLTPVRIHIHPDTFGDWCEQRGCRPDLIAQARYASEQANWTPSQAQPANDDQRAEAQDR